MAVDGVEYEGPVKLHVRWAAGSFVWGWGWRLGRQGFISFSVEAKMVCRFILSVPPAHQIVVSTLFSPTILTPPHPQTRVHTPHSPPQPYAPPYQLPLDVLLGQDHSFLFALRLPDPKLAATNLASRLRYIMDRVSLAAFGVTAVQAVAQPPAAGPGGVDRSSEGADSPNALRKAAAMRTSLSSVALGGGSRDGSGVAGGAAAAAGVGVGSSHDEEQQQQQHPLHRSVSAGSQPAAAAAAQPLLSTPTIGHLALRRLTVALRLDEKRVAELLQGNVQVGGVLGCL